MRGRDGDGTVTVLSTHDKEDSLLSLSSRFNRLACGAVALLAAVAVTAPADAAPTAVERSTLNVAYAGDAVGLNFAQPGDDLAFHFVRKAG
jgi:hypothetical protein